MIVKARRRNLKQQTHARKLDVSQSIGLLGIIVGLGALCAWSVLPVYVISHLGLISHIHPNAAFGFVLIGFSLRLARYEGVTPWVHSACKLFRISVGLLGLLSLANIWFHLNLGIDKFIVRDPTLLTPGVMQPAAALCFYMLGCALVLLSAGRNLLCQIVSLLVSTVTVAILIASGYALLAPSAFQDYLSMPGLTALILLILSLGVLNSTVTQPLLTVMTSDSAGAVMARRLLPASLLIPIALGFLRLIGQNAGWFGPVLGLALHVVTTMLLLAVFIWWNATAIDHIARDNRRFELAVQDTRTGLLEILRIANNAVFEHDLQGNVVFFNTAAEHLFGISQSEAQKITVYDLMSPESECIAREVFGGSLMGGLRRPETFLLRTVTTEQELEVFTNVMCDRNGTPVGFFSLVSPLHTNLKETSSRERILDPVRSA